ncbi:hypothetical protein ACJX0J_014818, partial [Zea mays]
ILVDQRKNIRQSQYGSIYASLETQILLGIFLRKVTITGKEKRIMLHLKKGGGSAICLSDHVTGDLSKCLWLAQIMWFFAFISNPLQRQPVDYANDTCDVPEPKINEIHFFKKAVLILEGDRPIEPLMLVTYFEDKLNTID